MAATRLSESQKSDLVVRFRDGASSQELAASFGCSANTVSRVVKAALDPQEYERLKRSRAGRRARRGRGEEEPMAGAPSSAAAVQVELISPPAGGTPEADLAGDDDDGPGVLAIDDADDFGADDDEEEEADDGDDNAEFVTVPVVVGLEERSAPTAVPLTEASLPASVYMLVDKTVELQARPLSEFPELGRLPEEERERQALLVFANPRQAKRQCGRSQRVIKLPDAQVLQRTAPYLLAQGISRVVLEGALYSLPGS
jgi:hypothetical protein